MKNLIAYFFLLSFFLMTACSTTKSTESSADASSTSIKTTAETANQHYTSLADYLRNNASVQISGTDPNIRLQIRGMGSLTSDTRPFIYINRNPIGRDYNRANNAINPDNIKRVEVISSLAELTRYGQEGHSGVIKIHTKTVN